VNDLPSNTTIGTLGELLVQLRLLQYKVQAAPPVRDSGNDLIAVRGGVFKALQVKTSVLGIPKRGRLKRRYDILALVRLQYDGERLDLDQSDIFLLSRAQVERGAGRSPEAPPEEFRICQARVDVLFARPRRHLRGAIGALAR
jgi:hypothetical protein